MQAVVLIFIIALTIFVWKSWKILSSVPDDTGKGYENKKVTELLRVNEFPLRDEFKESHPIRNGSYLLEYKKKTATDRNTDHFLKADLFTDALKKISSFDNSHAEANIYDSNYDIVFYAR